MKSAYSLIATLLKAFSIMAWMLFSLSLVYFSYALIQGFSQIPALLEEAQAIRASAADIVEETQKIRASAADIVEETQRIRRKIPKIIAKADALVDKSQKIIEDSALSAAKGVLKSPLTLARSIEEEIKEGIAVKQAYGSEVWERLLNATYQLVNAPERQLLEWREPNSNIKGKAAIARSYQKDGELCHLIEYTLTLPSGGFGASQENICKNSREDLQEELQHLTFQTIEAEYLGSF